MPCVALCTGREPAQDGLYAVDAHQLQGLQSETHHRHWGAAWTHTLADLSPVGGRQLRLIGCNYLANTHANNSMSVYLAHSCLCLHAPVLTSAAWSQYQGSHSTPLKLNWMYGMTVTLLLGQPWLCNWQWLCN